MYLHRRQTARLRSLLRSFPAVLLAGPRQCGKKHARAARAVDRYAIACLRQCMKDLGLRRGWVVTTARERRRISAGIEIIPWAELAIF